MLTAVNASVACYRKAPNSRQFFESHADSGDVVFYVHQDGDDPDNASKMSPKCWTLRPNGWSTASCVCSNACQRRLEVRAFSCKDARGAGFLLKAA